MQLNLDNVLIHNKYKILHKLKESGMSIVYRAYNVVEKSDVAIKFLKPDVTSSYIEDILRFQNEIKLTSTLDHPDIIKTYDSGEYKNIPYIITELLEYDNLAEMLEQKKILPINDILEIIIQITEALNYVHKKNILHRDIKPENIMIKKQSGSFKVKLLDFGVALIIELSNFMETNEIAGTFAYMSPEATGMLDKSIDERSDLYSLGMVLYHLLTGIIPFDASKIGTQLHKQVAIQPITPGTIRTDIPHALEQIVLKLVSKDPDLRYQGIQGLLYDLKRCRAGEHDFLIGEKDHPKKLNYQTLLIGREKELSKLKNLYAETLNAHGSLCLISGKPGIGKSRIAQEFKKYVQKQGGLFLEGCCIKQEYKLPYQPFKDILDSYIKYIEKMNEEERDYEIKKIQGVMGNLGKILIQLNKNMEKILGKVNDIVTLEPHKENKRFLMVVSQLFYSLNKNQPCVLFLDDLQWSDESTLHLLFEIATEINNKNLLIIGAYRDNEINNKHNLQYIIKNKSTRKIILDELNYNQIDKIISNILKIKNCLQPELTKYILQKAQGNPFFTILIIRELIDYEAIFWADNIWNINWEKIRLLSIPENIADFILQQMQDFSDEIKKMLSIAAVRGKIFEIDLIEQLVNQNITDLVDKAIKLQMIEWIDSKKDKVIFLHDKIHEAYYKMLLDKECKKYHMKIAEIIEKQNTENFDVVLFDLAYHFLEGDNKEKGMHYCFKAGLKAKENHANYEAVRYFNETLNIIEKNNSNKNDTWIYIKEALAEVYLTIGKSDEAILIYKELMPFREKPLEKAKIYRGIGTAYFKKGDWENCEKNLAKGLLTLDVKIALSTRQVRIGIIKEFLIHCLHNLLPIFFQHRKEKTVSEKDKEKIKIFYSLNWMYGFSNAEKLVYNIIKMLNIAESNIGKSSELGKALSMYGSFLDVISLFNKSIKYHQKAITLKREFNDEPGLAQSLQFYAYSYKWAGDYQSSLKYLKEARQIFEKIGDMWELRESIYLLGYIYSYMSQFNKAITYEQQALDIANKINDYSGICRAEANLMQCHTFTGNYQKAEQHGNTALTISKNNNILFVNCRINIQFGELELERNNFKKAREYLERAKHLFENNHFIKEYTIYLYALLADLNIEEYKINEKKNNRKKQNKEIKIIENYCKTALKKTKRWVNQHGNSLRIFAKYYTIIGEIDKAVKFFNLSIEHLKKLNYKYYLGKTYYEFALFLQEINREREAEENWVKAYNIFSNIGSQEYIKKCSNTFGYRGLTTEDKNLTSMQRFHMQRRIDIVLNTCSKLGSIFDFDELLNGIMDRAIELVGAERGILYFYNKNKDGYNLIPKIFRNVSQDEISITQMSNGIIKQVIEEREPLLFNEAFNNINLKKYRNDIESIIKSVICAPIIIKEQLRGIIYLDNNLLSGLFNENDLEILRIISNLAGILIENVELYKNVIIKDRIEQDLKFAKDIQKFFLPKKIEDIKNMAINTYYAPANFIGGDYYDIIKINDKQYGFIIADVSGHGTSAAIVMSAISSIVHSIIKTIKNTAEFMNKLDKLLFERLQNVKYATAIFMIYNTETNQFEYTNAGHPNIIYYNFAENKLTELSNKGLPIGIMKNNNYRKSSLLFQQGDILFLTTDGLYDAYNRHNSSKTKEKTKEVLLQNKAKSVEDININILTELNKIKENEIQHDDIAFLIIKQQQQQ